MLSVHENRRVLIEQAIARGETPTQIAMTVGVPLRVVAAVRAGMDAACAVPDRTPKQAGQERSRRNKAPCGTPAACRRHRDMGEPVDPACQEAYRAWNRARMHRARRRAS